MQSVTLNQWLQQRSRNVWIAAAIGIALPMLLFVLWQTNTENKRGIEILTQISSMTKTALIQNNRIAIESALQLAATHLDASRVEFINEGTVDILLITDPKAQAGIFQKQIQTSLAGMPEYKIVMFVPVWHQSWLLFLFLILGLILLLTQIMVHRKITAGVQKEIIAPILSVMSEDDQVNPKAFITEVTKVIEQYKNKVRQITLLEITKSMLDKEAALGRISAQLCHDLKSPLIGVEIAAGSRTWEEFQNKKPALESAINKLYSMIDNLKRSDIEGLVRPVIAEFMPDNLLSTSKSSCELRQIKLETTYESLLSGETQLKLDFDKVERAIANIVLNAVEGGATRIKINMQSVKSDLSIKISNNGAPIPTEILPRLFQRGATFGKSGGTGLGLAFVESITKGHGGSVRHEFADGLTTFIMSFSAAVISSQINPGNDLVTEASMNNSTQPTELASVLLPKIGIMLEDIESAISLRDEIFAHNPQIKTEILDGIKSCSVLCCSDPDLAMEARLQGIHVVLAVEQGNVQDLAKRLLTLMQRNNS